MSKIVRILLGILVAVAGLLVAPFVYEAVRSAVQMRALQSRTDCPQIAAACVGFARSLTNSPISISIADPRVPALLRSLSPRSISASTNHVTMEFHGGPTHYGYKVRQSETAPGQWTLAFYTEQGERLLTTITHD